MLDQRRRRSPPRLSENLNQASVLHFCRGYTTAYFMVLNALKPCTHQGRQTVFEVFRVQLKKTVAASSETQKIQACHQEKRSRVP